MVHPVEEALERADTLYENGLGARAIQNLEMVLFRFPEDARLVIRISELYVLTGDDPGAASYYLMALRLDPQDPELQIRMGAVLEAVKTEVEKLAEGSIGLPALRRRRQVGVPTIDLDAVDVPEDVLQRVPLDLVERFRVVPVAVEGQTLLLATAQPDNRRALEEIGFVTGLAVNCAIATDREISSALKRFYNLPTKAKKKR